MARTLFALADHLDQVFQQLAGVAAVAVVDLQAQGKQAELIAFVKLGKVADRLRQAHAHLHVALDAAHGLLERRFGAVDRAQHSVRQGAPRLEAAHAVVQQLR